MMKLGYIVLKIKLKQCNVFLYTFSALKLIPRGEKICYTHDIMEKTTIKTPPRASSDISIIHSIKQVYANIYLSGNKLAKRDKLGIHAHIEKIALESMSDIVRAQFSGKSEKLATLESVRISLEVLKHLLRMEYEIKIVDEKTYIRISALLIATSKQANGWIKYLTQNPSR